MPEKHFPRVWQLEKNKRLLFAGRCNASHNTQLTAYSPMIHGQELGVSEITGEKNKCVVLLPFAIKFALFHQQTPLHTFYSLSKTSFQSIKKMLSAPF